MRDLDMIPILIAHPNCFRPPKTTSQDCNDPKVYKRRWLSGAVLHGNHLFSGAGVWWPFTLFGVYDLTR